MNITVSKIERANYDNLVSIYERQRQYHYNIAEQQYKGDFEKVSIEDFKRYTKSANELVLVVEDEDRQESDYIGFLAIHEMRIYEEDIAFIDDLFVDKEYRCNNIGILLLQNAISWVREIGLKRIYVQVIKGNESALRFYERYDFHLQKCNNQVYQLYRDLD